jgi:integrase
VDAAAVHEQSNLNHNMHHRPKQTRIACQFFDWRIFQRDGVYYADGRANDRNLGKHSLSTRDREEALVNLRRLDHQKAVDLGLVGPTDYTVPAVLPIARGWDLYLEHCGRPQVLGGASAGTQKRYRAVVKKHVTFCASTAIETWVQVDKSAVEKYGTWLSNQGYAVRTIFLELTLIKSVIGWLAGENHLPRTHAVHLPLSKPQGTDTYCYSRAEVKAMVDHCRQRPDLRWLADVLVGLACTGLRISELAGLRWSDVDFRSMTIRVADERSSQAKRQLGTIRTTKGRRSRSVPIHGELARVLMAMAKSADGRVFHGVRGGVLRPRNVLALFIRDVIEPLKERFPTPVGEVGFEHGRLHSFRHFFCSESFAGGASEGEVKDWLGHADSKMVDHYRHLRPELGRRTMEQIDFLGRETGSGRASGSA